MTEGKEEKLDGEIDNAEPVESEGSALDEGDDQIEQDETDEDLYESEYLEESKTVKKKKWKFAIFAVLLVVVGTAGFLLWFMNGRNWKLSGDASPDQRSEPIQGIEDPKASDASFSPQKTLEPETTVRARMPEPAPSGMADKLEKATRLRDALLKKQEEIRTLKQYYRNRIDEVRDEILDEKRKKGITAFQQALKSKRIELGLRTIGRRRLYISKLNEPLEQLHESGEELLYIKRLVGIQIQMAPVVNGIDMDKLGKHIDLIIEKKSGKVDDLVIDIKETSAPALEVIWKEIVRAENAEGKPATKGGNPEKKKASSQRRDKMNRVIWKEICAGDLNRKHELTRLSLNAAECLSKWEGKDLFLNGITELPASIARQLSQWEGEWLCLNRLASLSSEAAEGLSRWKGIRLSLNSLTELTPQAAKHLSQWGGKQMEVVGLAKISPEANKYLSAWQEAGGELHIQTLP